jgi:hypothetical protein
VPITNYDEMHTIFSFSLATGKYAMGSSEPLGSLLFTVKHTSVGNPKRKV